MTSLFAVLPRAQRRYFETVRSHVSHAASPSSVGGSCTRQSATASCPFLAKLQALSRDRSTRIESRIEAKIQFVFDVGRSVGRSVNQFRGHRIVANMLLVAVNV